MELFTARKLSTRLEAFKYPEKIYPDQLEWLLTTPSLRIRGFLEWFLLHIHPKHSIVAAFTPQELQQYHHLKEKNRFLKGKLLKQAISMIATTDDPELEPSASPSTTDKVQIDLDIQQLKNELKQQQIQKNTLQNMIQSKQQSIASVDTTTTTGTLVVEPTMIEQHVTSQLNPKVRETLDGYHHQSTVSIHEIQRTETAWHTQLMTLLAEHEPTSRLPKPVDWARFKRVCFHTRLQQTNGDTVLATEAAELDMALIHEWPVCLRQEREYEQILQQILTLLTSRGYSEWRQSVDQKKTQLTTVHDQLKKIVNSLQEMMDSIQERIEIFYPAMQPVEQTTSPPPSDEWSMIESLKANIEQEVDDVITGQLDLLSRWKGTLIQEKDGLDTQETEECVHYVEKSAGLLLRAIQEEINRVS